MAVAAAKLQKNGSKQSVCYLPGNTAVITDVERWIFDNAQQIKGTQVFQLLSLGKANDWAKAVAGGVTPVTAFIGPGVRALVNAGLAKNIRCNLSQVHRLYDGAWRPDVAFAHVSLPDEAGRVTLGLNAGLDDAAVKAARFKIAVVNAQMPRWHIGQYFDPETNQHYESGCPMYLRDFDVVVHIDQPLLEHTMAPKADAVMPAEKIARHIMAELEKDALPDGTLPHVLQLGIGAIPNAIAAELAAQNRCIEGVWSEMFSDGVLDLYRKGLIKRAGGTNLRDHAVVGFVLGSRDLYDTMHENPHFLVLPQQFVNDPGLIKQNRHMVSVNTTLAVSLAGEVAAATRQRHYYSDVGGQNDFALGATWAEGGLSFIALPSTAKSGDAVISKIVPTLPEGAHHTISADLPVVIVTEYGLADLRMVDDRTRVSRMLQIVHPDLRTQIAKHVRTLPAMQGVDSITPRLVTLRNDSEAIVRPATHEDIELIREYIPHLSKGDRETRYFSCMPVETLTASSRLIKLYDSTLDYNHHGVFVMEQGGYIIGIAHAFQTSEGSYEVSFSRHSELQGLGIGTHLMEALVDWARAKGVKELHAITFASKNPRMRSLFDRYNFVSETDPDDYTTVIYRGAVPEIRSQPNL